MRNVVVKRRLALVRYKPRHATRLFLLCSLYAIFFALFIREMPSLYLDLL